ncbi:hypothetical protein B0H10DRAFT_2006279 [Mycena sp. CBHHK59/15]|nr:hypothetical protein B0H10DRAFT_2006279 [Mycena sp. CBHHK59/15]
MFQWLPHSFILLLVVSFSNGAITNTTIDDSSGSFKFVGSWNTITPTSPCEICSSKPDASKIHGGTWHDGNIRTGASPTTGSFTFQGSAVYIFGIDQAISQPDIAFTLGSTQAVHHYPGTEQFVYSALFFQATGLAADQTHTVNWVFNVDGSTGVPVQAALFDYAIVTSGQEDVQTTTTSRSPETLSKTPRQSSASASVSAKSASSANQESTSSRSSATSAPESQSSTS